MSDRQKRLNTFSSIPRMAREDYRNLLDDSGNHKVLSSLPRSARRKLKKESEPIARAYSRIMRNLLESGARLPVDQLLRSMTLEYINRYARSGTNNQPVSFNYFEPFSFPKIIPRSTAPYLSLKNENDHLFDLFDYLEFLTSNETSLEDVSHLKRVPESEIFHFSTTGDLFSTTVFDAKNRECVVSGFSLTRIGDVVHWYLLAGEIFSEREWAEIRSQSFGEATLFAPAWKRKFLEEVSERVGGETGLPLPLEGTERAWRTIVAGEFNFEKRKHISRAYFAEKEHSFTVHCDDPEVISTLAGVEHDNIIREAHEKMSIAGSLFNLAEGLLHLPIYFASRIAVSKKQISQEGAGGKVMRKRGGDGLGRSYKYITSLEVVDHDVKFPIVRVNLPHFEVETEGHWRRLNFESSGQDEHGNTVRGKTWVKKRNLWRNEKAFSNIIYVKDTLSSARITLEKLQNAARRIEPENAGTLCHDLDTQELYMMRCATMEDEVYKVGWTRTSSYDRAKELSAASGVPDAFIVVSYWKFRDAKGLETEVHAALSPYRISNNREFFRSSSYVIKRVVEQALLRATS